MIPGRGGRARRGRRRGGAGKIARAICRNAPSSSWTTRARPSGNLGAAYRREFHLPVIAVGGSNGKTTTKELIASVLRQKADALERGQFQQ